MQVRVGFLDSARHAKRSSRRMMMRRGGWWECIQLIKARTSHAEHPQLNNTVMFQLDFGI